MKNESHPIKEVDMKNLAEITSIRALREYQNGELRDLLKQYHAEYRAVENRIAEIRESRGTKIKQDNGPHFEVGRDDDPGRGGW